MNRTYINCFCLKGVSIFLGCFFLSFFAVASDVKKKVVQDETVQQLFLVALENSPVIQYALAQQNATQSNQKIMASFLKPDVTFQSELSYAWMQKQSYGRTANQLQATYPLYQPERDDRYNIAFYQNQESKWQLEEVKQDLLLKVSKLYFTYWIQKSEQIFLQKEFESITEIMEQVQQRFTVGYQDLNDISDIQARLDRNRADLIRTEQDLRITHIDLESILGTQIDLLNFPPPKKDVLPSHIEWSEDLQELITLHPAVLRYEQAILAAHKKMDYEQNKNGPVIKAFGTIVKNDSNGYFYDDAQGAKVGLRLSVPLYLGGQTKASIAKARFESHQISALKLQKELVLTARLKSAVESLQYNQKRLLALKDVLASNKQALMAAENGLSTGNRNILDLLDAERNLHRAERDIQVVINNLWLNWYLYQWSIGNMQVL